MKLICRIVLLSLILYTPTSSADVVLLSPLGNKIIFSQEKVGEHYDQDSWGKLLFEKNNHVFDLSWSDRYYNASTPSLMSPSGNYLIVYSVSGGYVDVGEGKMKYTDRAYCSVVDMRDGCIISDWSGWACSYKWKRNEDVLSSSEDVGADTFDFISARPAIKKVVNKMALLDHNDIQDYLRCDAPGKENINIYQQLIRENKKARSLVISSIKSYLSRVSEFGTIKVKSFIYTYPDNNSKTKSYLIAGDKIKILGRSEDNQWANIAYIKASGDPLIAWIQSSNLN